MMTFCHLHFTFVGSSRTRYDSPCSRSRHQALRRRDGGGRRQLLGGSGPGRRLPRPERRREVHHHAHDHPVPRARRGPHPLRRSARWPRPAARPSAGSATSPRTIRSTPRCWWRNTWSSSAGCASWRGPALAQGHGRGRRGDGDRDRLLPAHRRAVQGLSPAGRARRGDPASARPAGARRADRGTRPQSAGRDPPAHRRPGTSDRTVLLSTHVLSEAQSRLLPTPDHQPRPRSRRTARSRSW